MNTAWLLMRFNTKTQQATHVGIYSEERPTCVGGEIHLTIMSTSRPRYHDARQEIITALARSAGGWAVGWYAWILPLLDPNTRHEVEELRRRA